MILINLKKCLVLTCAAALAAGAFGVGSVASAKTERPNILLLLADDLGYGELGCYGQEVIRTPNIDRLAGEGMRFTQFYAGSAVCAPSRAVLMTGKQVGRLNIRGNYGLIADQVWGRVALKKENMTVAEMLRGAGYQTAFIGKWHLGVPQHVNTWAAGRGFEYAVQEQWGEKAEGGKFDVREHWVNGREDSIFYDYTQYDCLDAFRTELALDFLDEQRDADRPLFLFMSYRTPHAHEFDLRENALYHEHGWPEIQRQHAARITMLDEQVQRLLDKLEAMGELENTLILFTSDNGPTEENDFDPNQFHSSGELRGIKRDMYEGGIRVPLIAVWPGRIQPGATTEQSAAFYDLMPTFADVAGITAPADTDGHSILSTLLGGDSAQHDHFYWELQVSTEAENFRQGVRLGDWKGIRYGVGGPLELYNLVSDPQETRDVADEHPERLDAIERLMQSESHPVPYFPHAGGKGMPKEQTN
jgi:arylsulfatase A-like enzyme